MTFRATSRGFTLLELLVVLSVVALTAGLTLPSASRWIDATRERGWRDDLSAALTALPVRAFQRGAPIVLDAGAVRQLSTDMPADVKVELSEPLRYGASGAAGGGELGLRVGSGKHEMWKIEPITGFVKR